MTESGPRRLKLLFVAVTCDEAFFEPVKRGMADAAAMMGVDATFTGSKGVDADEMSKLARDALAQGIDGLAISTSSMRRPLRRSSRQPTPKASLWSASISTTAPAAPAISAASRRTFRRPVARSVGGSPIGSGPAAQLFSRCTMPVSQRSNSGRDGLKEALSGHGIRWIETITGHEPETAARHILGVLRANPDASAILATGQADTEGAALAAERFGRPVYAAGFDLSPEILRLLQEGHLDCTVDQQPYTQGFYPVVQLVLNIRYGLLPVDMDAGACMIDRSNVARIVALAKAGYR